jgi:hypothetical protein
MSTHVVRSVPDSKESPFAATALLLLLAGCGGSVAPATDPSNLNWIGGYTGSYGLSFTNPGEQFSDTGLYMHVSIQSVSQNKFNGIFRPTADKQGPLAGNFANQNTIIITEFGNATVGRPDILSPLADRCDVGSAVISPLTGNLPDGITLTLTGTVAMSCHYPSGTYSTVANLKIVVPKQYDDPCFSVTAPAATGGASFSASCRSLSMIGSVGVRKA